MLVNSQQNSVRQASAKTGDKQGAEQKKSNLEQKLKKSIDTLIHHSKIRGRANEQTLQSYNQLTTEEKDAVVDLLNQLDSNKLSGVNINDILQEAIDTIKENNETPPVTMETISRAQDQLQIERVQAPGEKSTSTEGFQKALEDSINSLSEKPSKSTLRKQGLLV